MPGPSQQAASWGMNNYYFPLRFFWKAFGESAFCCTDFDILTDIVGLAAGFIWVGLVLIAIFSRLFTDIVVLGFSTPVFSATMTMSGPFGS